MQRTASALACSDDSAAPPPSRWLAATTPPPRRRRAGLRPRLRRPAAIALACKQSAAGPPPSRWLAAKRHSLPALCRVHLAHLRIKLHLPSKNAFQSLRTISRRCPRLLNQSASLSTTWRYPAVLSPSLAPQCRSRHLPRALSCVVCPTRPHQTALVVDVLHLRSPHYPAQHPARLRTKLRSSATLSVFAPALSCPASSSHSQETAFFVDTLRLRATHYPAQHPARPASNCARRRRSPSSLPAPSCPASRSPPNQRAPRARGRSPSGRSAQAVRLANAPGTSSQRI
jgi:hypothetical protein